MSNDTGLNPRLRVASPSFPNWKKPKPIGCFSVDTNRCYERGHGNLRYFKYPNEKLFPLDLNDGMGTAKMKINNPMDEGIAILLQFIVDRHIYSSTAGHDKSKYPLYPTEFVCLRGLLRLIMCTPSEYRQNWIIDVTHYKGIFYLCQRETEEAKLDRIRETPQQKRMCSWGYKFEQFCLAKSPDENPETNVPVDECSEFLCVFKTQIESHNLLYGAEMDGIRSERPVHLDRDIDLDNLEFLELKTSLKDMSDRQMHSYLSYKIRNWWCQSFLVGIQKIIVGWRDHRGHVGNIEELSVSRLPKEAKNWCPSNCAWFLISFLDCIKSLMANVDSPFTVYEFKYDAAKSLITYEAYGNSMKTFLPEFYIDFIEGIAKNSKK